MTDLDILFPLPTGGRNADDMGMPSPIAVVEGANMSDKRDFVISDSEINPMFKIEVSKTPEPNFVFFASPTEEIMRLDKDGMTYKGQRIEDGGEAHKAFMEVMRIMQEPT